MKGLCDWLATHPRTVLSILTVVLPLIPAFIGWALHANPIMVARNPPKMVRDENGAAIEAEPRNQDEISLDDGPILSAWTYIHVATFAYLVFLFHSGPPIYLSAYTATMAAHGLFMQQLGKPLGIWLASKLAVWGLNGGLENGAASFSHHLVLGAFTWLMAAIIVEISKMKEQRTKIQETNENRKPTEKVPVDARHGQTAAAPRLSP